MGSAVKVLCGDGEVPSRRNYAIDSASPKSADVGSRQYRRAHLATASWISAQPRTSAQRHLRVPIPCDLLQLAPKSLGPQESHVDKVADVNVAGGAR